MHDSKYQSYLKASLLLELPLLAFSGCMHNNVGVTFLSNKSWHHRTRATFFYDFPLFYSSPRRRTIELASIFFYLVLFT